MTDEQYAEDLRIMYAADMRHRDQALADGNMNEARRFQQAMNDSLKELEKMGMKL